MDFLAKAVKPATPQETSPEEHPKRSMLAQFLLQQNKKLQLKPSKEEAESLLAKHLERSMKNKF